MPSPKKIRVFAGPNGSGKSTLFTTIADKFKVGYFVNSDEIEREIASKGFVNLENYGLQLTEEDLELFKKEDDAVSLIKKAEKEGHIIDVEIRENVIVDQSKNTHSYEASLISAFLRKHLAVRGISFSYESVMSHPSKLNEIKEAKAKGYKTYLYFVCLQDADMNVSRVSNRIQKGGHAVDPDRIIRRYTETLSNLFPALLLVDKAYLFDNSSDKMELVAEVENGRIEILTNRTPNWFVEYVVKKLTLG